MPAFFILHNVHVNGQASIESSCTMFLFEIRPQSVLSRAQQVGRQRRGVQGANRAAEPTRAGCEAQRAPTSPAAAGEWRRRQLAARADNTFVQLKLLPEWLGSGRCLPEHATPASNAAQRAGRAANAARRAAERAATATSDGAGPSTE